MNVFQFHRHRQTANGVVDLFLTRSTPPPKKKQKQVATAALDAVAEVASSVSSSRISSEDAEIGEESDASASAATLNSRSRLIARLLLEPLAPAAAFVRGDARPGVAAAAARAERALQSLRFVGGGEGLCYESEEDEDEQEEEDDDGRGRSRRAATAAASASLFPPKLPVPKALECPTVSVLRSRLAAAAAVLSPSSSSSSSSSWEQKAEALVQITALSRGVARRVRANRDEDQQFAAALADAAAGAREMAKLVR